MTDWTTRFSLSGRTALVTGASKGIGAEICSVFADAGADIVAVARDASGLMVEWAPHNVQVNVICPTVILTPMGLQVWGEEAKARPMLERTPLGRFGQPVEVADLALFLASDASALINGESILIDGGFSAI